MMHWRAEPVPSPTPARSRRPMPSARSQRSEQPVLVRFLTMAVAALLTANGVIIAEQASGRDLITLSRDGVDNAREAVARLLDPNKESTDKVAGQVLEQTTTTTAPGETTTTTGAAAVAPPPVETPTSGPAATAPATTPTTAKKAKGGTDWAHVADTVRPYVEKETSLPFKGAVPVAVQQ